jgi:predicted nuclease of predicted toxin-antitoxin system
MRLLLDECLPARLRRDLPGHEILTVPRAGWAGIKNGNLLRLIADSGQFDVFLTMDKSMPHQQQFADLPFAVVVLRAKSNAIADTRPLMPEVLRRLAEFQPGHTYVLTQPD